MRIRHQSAALFVIALAGIGGARAEPGSFFKNMFGGGGGGGSSSESPGLAVPKAQDPDEAYCPQIDIHEGGSAMRAFAGGGGDASRLRHQVTFGQMSRECTLRAGGAVGVRVGVQIRALLGPAGAPGTFDAPLTVSLKYNDKVVASHTRRVAVSVPAGSAQGQASVVEDELLVPADMAAGYDIEVALAGTPARAKAPARNAGRRPKPPSAEAAAAAEAPVPGQ